MRVIDLHDVELLYDLAVYFDFPALELWHDTFTQIDGNHVVKNSERLDLFVGVLDIGNHLACIVLVFEQCLYSFSSGCYIVQILLGGSLFLLSFADLRLDFVLQLKSGEDGFDIIKFSFAPMIHVEVRVSKAVAQGLALLFEGWACLLAAEDHFVLVVVDIGLQIEILVVR